MAGKVEIQSAISIFLVLLVVAIFALAHPAGRPATSIRAGVPLFESILMRKAEAI